MSTSVAPLSARSHTVVTAAVATMAIWGISPLAEIIAIRWPLHFSEAPWRYQTFLLLMSNGPQFAFLAALIAVVGVFVGSRRIVRGAAVALGLLAVVHVVVVLLFILDYFQVRHLIGQDAKRAFNLVAIKTIVFGVALALLAGWAACQAWLASTGREESAVRRTKGHGLVVGQDDDPVQ